MQTLKDFWSEYRRNASWADRSLLLFTPDSFVRKLSISLTHTQEWRMLILMLILANCVTMTLIDPLNPESDYNKLLDNFELGFTIAFTVELALQVLACGLIVPDPNEGELVDVFFRGWRDILDTMRCRPPLVTHVLLQPAYMHVSWNRLDALVVGGSWAAFFAGCPRRGSNAGLAAPSAACLHTPLL